MKESGGTGAKWLILQIDLWSFDEGGKSAFPRSNKIVSST
jgi:hypothetical protein